MALFDWLDSLSVGVHEIDGQHKKLVGMINSLNEAMKTGQSKVALGSIIDGLVEYTSSHFALEEKYFDQFGYIDALRHKREHAEFVKKVMDFRKGHSEGRVMLSLDVMNFLKDWLIKHIQNSDKLYAPFLIKNGVH